MDLQEEYRDEFIEEAQENVERAKGLVASLSKDIAVDSPEFKNIYRSMHSLKGDSGLFGFTHVSKLAKHLEGMMLSIEDGSIAIDSNWPEIITAGCALLDKALLTKDPNFEIDLSDILSKFENLGYSPATEE